jgi:hypothetical protein
MSGAPATFTIRVDNVGDTNLSPLFIWDYENGGVLNGRALWGLGEAIVGGIVSPDTIVADKATGKVKKYEVAEKTVITVLTESGTREEPLTDAQVCAAVECLVDEVVLVETKAEFLTRLALKGETPEEITAFARELRSRAVQPRLDDDLRESEILDVVGTGGDRLSTFNIYFYHGFRKKQGRYIHNY